MEGNLTCSGKDAGKAVDAAVKALADFKNPYDTANKAIRKNGSVTKDADVGFTALQASGSKEIFVTTCFVTACSTGDNRSSTKLTVE